MKVIIVGAGIAGLAAGTFAAQSGFDVEILESHTIPGGNSTSWKRGGYLFEGGMHWLVGSGERTPLHGLWREVGALRENTRIHYKDPFLTYIDENGQVCLYRDPDRLRDHLTQLSPEDAAAIRELTRNIKAFGKLSIPVTDIKGVRVKQRQSPPLSMLFAFFGVRSRMKTLDSMTTEEYIECFRHPAIRALLSSMIPARGYSAASLLFTLGGLANGDGGYPEGGSLRMAQNMAGTFESAGGTIQYGVRVEKVDVADGRARGVWAGGEFHEADAVIVTSDTRVAIDSLLDNPLDELWANELRSDITPLNCTFICLGVKADLNAYPEELNFPISRPFTFAGVRQEHLGFNNYASYPGYAPEGCTALTAAFCEDSYDEWKKAKEDGSYERKKKELADLVIDRLAEAVPEIAGNVEVWDIATPLTYERYCGTWRGSWMSVLPPNCKRQMFPTKPETIESLYLAGHRLHLPGGLPTALMTAREAVQHLCKDTDTVFQGCMSENIIKKF